MVVLGVRIIDNKTNGKLKENWDRKAVRAIFRVLSSKIFDSSPRQLSMIYLLVLGRFPETKS